MSEHVLLEKRSYLQLSPKFLHQHYQAPGLTQGQTQAWDRLTWLVPQTRTEAIKCQLGLWHSHLKIN